ncbi:MAG TPA: hypothetical protein P5214_08450 [Rectinema sp.]|nr:hypothetical protein [Rectinema sp.]
MKVVTNTYEDKMIIKLLREYYPKVYDDLLYVVLRNRGIFDATKHANQTVNGEKGNEEEIRAWNKAFFDKMDELYKTRYGGVK